MHANILIAIAVPLCGLLLFGALQLNDKYRFSSDMSRVIALASLAPVISELVHEMQKERGMSAGFISSSGVNFANEIGEECGQVEGRRIIQRPFLQRPGEFRPGMDGDRLVVPGQLG